MNPYPRTWIEIDLPALAHNLARVRAKIGRANLTLVAKADAYGHGLVPVSRFALRNGADWIGVATVQEGIALRDAGIEAPILVLSPILEVEAQQAVFYGLRLMVERAELGRAISQAAQELGREAFIHIPIDTGLARFGCAPGDAPALLQALEGLPGIVIEGIGTHFADSGFNPERTHGQARAFQELLAQCGPRDWMIHASNSAAATKYPEFAWDMVRVGIAAYGIDPYGMLGGQARPVLTWKARVMSLRTRPAGSLISYSGTYQCPRETVIATLGAGYGDGYPRSLSNAGFVSLGGVRCPVIGLVCMDQVLVDATDAPGVQIGDEACLIGDSATVVELSKLAKTNVHEIVTRIMSRVPRRYRME